MYHNDTRLATFSFDILESTKRYRAGAFRTLFNDQKSPKNISTADLDEKRSSAQSSN